MKIVLSGVETNNKGAELMLYAMLQEIERTFPEAEVYLPLDSVSQGLDYIHTKANIKLQPFEKYYQLLLKFKVHRVLKKLHFDPIYIKDIYPIKGVDYFIDGSGLKFSDTMSAANKGEAERWRKLLSGYKKNGTKIVFLPQSFGPFEKNTTRETMRQLSVYADLIYSREDTSTKYLNDLGFVNMIKVEQEPDFTTLVEGYIPEKYKYLQGAVCVIPNMQMVKQGAISKEKYIDLIKQICLCVKNSGREVFLLNHQGEEDEKLALLCKEAIGGNIVFVNGLNALEIKGVISQSYIVISSRFHGVVSSLNSCVPCLATSWSHKYEELFLKYNQENCVLPINDIDASINTIRLFMDEEINSKIRKSLIAPVDTIKSENKIMWHKIWSL